MHQSIPWVLGSWRWSSWSSNRSREGTPARTWPTFLVAHSIGTNYAAKSAGSPAMVQLWIAQHFKCFRTVLQLRLGGQPNNMTCCKYLCRQLCISVLNHLTSHLGASSIHCISPPSILLRASHLFPATLVTPQEVIVLQMTIATRMMKTLTPVICSGKWSPLWSRWVPLPY